MKTKILHSFLLLMALALPQIAFAYDFSYTYQGNTLYYNIVNGNAEVTSQNNQFYTTYTTYPTGSLVIPDSVTHGGTTYAVTSIGSYAFKDCSGLTSVTIPNSVDSIGHWAFDNCGGLTQVIFTGTIEQWCNISIGSSYSNPLYYAHHLYIGGSEVTSLVIPNNVTEIKQYVFSGCSGLTSVTIPNSVTSIGICAFQGCSGLTSIVVEAGNTHYDSRNNCNAIIRTELNQLVQGCKTTVIPSTVTSIGESAFSNCSSLTSVTIPNSVTSIGVCAFLRCSGLTSITIPNSVDSIGHYAFQNCSGLTSITIGNSVTSIGGCAFSYCSGLTSVTIPNSVTSIDTAAFWGCSGLTSITIPNSVTSIGYKAFEGCSSLTSVTIPNSVTNIGNWAFYNCSGLTSVTIGNSVTNIGGCAFYNCSGLTSVTIGNSVTSIGSSAFYNCSGLTSITIPNSMTSIGYDAFRGCSGLTSITIPNSVTSIGICAFQGCSGLTSIVVEAGNTHYDSRNNCNAIIRTELNQLVQGCKTTVIPSTVTSIGNYAFSGCSGLTSVTIPNSVTSIGHEAFRNCSELNDVKIKGCNTTIGTNAFPLTCTIAVPCRCLSYYQNSSNLSSYYIIRDVYEYTINTTQGGIVDIDESQICNNSITMTATGDEHHHFLHWEDGDTANPRTVTLTQDTTFAASFAPNMYTITVLPDDATHGSVNGDGDYEYGSSQEILATGGTGYHFIQWDDGNRDNPRTITVLGDATYTANFAIDTYYVSVTSSDVMRGVVSGGGEFVYGTPCTVTATPLSGYVFVRWSNGVTYNPYTFMPTANIELVAEFADEGQVANITVNVNNTAMGTVTGAGPYAIGAEATLEAVANEGYHFVRWQDNVTDNPRTVVVYADMSFTAFFESDDTQGIDYIEDSGIRIWSTAGGIVVEGCEGKIVSVYDMMGRRVTSINAGGDKTRIDVPSGVYLVKADLLSARKVVVIR